jgi:hypothetical protein
MQNLSNDLLSEKKKSEALVVEMEGLLEDS